jgi:hypothetical protein
VERFLTGMVDPELREQIAPASQPAGQPAG